MGIAFRCHTSIVEFYVDDLMDGIKQLESVFRNLESHFGFLFLSLFLRFIDHDAGVFVIMSKVKPPNRMGGVRN